MSADLTAHDSAYDHGNFVDKEDGVRGAKKMLDKKGGRSKSNHKHEEIPYSSCC